MSRVEEISQAIKDLDQEISRLKQQIKQLKRERTFVLTADKLQAKLAQKKERVQGQTELDVDVLGVVHEGWDCVESLKRFTPAAGTQTPLEQLLVASVYVKSLTDSLDKLGSRARTEAIELIQALSDQINRVGATT